MISVVTLFGFLVDLLTRWCATMLFVDVSWMISSPTRWRPVGFNIPPPQLRKIIKSVLAISDMPTFFSLELCTQLCRSKWKTGIEAVGLQFANLLPPWPVVWFHTQPWATNQCWSECPQQSFLTCGRTAKPVSNARTEIARGVRKARCSLHDWGGLHWSHPVAGLPLKGCFSHLWGSWGIKSLWSRRLSRRTKESFLKTSHWEYRFVWSTKLDLVRDGTPHSLMERGLNREMGWWFLSWARMTWLSAFFPFQCWPNDQQPLPITSQTRLTLLVTWSTLMLVPKGLKFSLFF